jgi:hypothetical protein
LNATGHAILDALRTVDRERAARLCEPAWGAAVRAVKQCQHSRFSEAYADVLAQPRWSAAARFFLDDLYGPGDFTRRDAEFARVVPSLVRLFPDPIVVTVRSLGELHALSERLDSAMGRAVLPLVSGSLSGAGYTVAWGAVGQPDARRRQIELMLEVGHALDRYTRNPLLRHSLRLMRGPAQLSGLAALQAFLERGFDTFAAMRGADPFLNLIAARELELSERLFAGIDLDTAVRGLPGCL